MKNLVFFDLETQKSDREVGGWEHKRDMQLSVAVTFSTADNHYHVYLEEDVNALIDELKGADKIIGFNIIQFDYEVLSRYVSVNFLPSCSLDLMEAVVRHLGHRVSLDNLAQATLGSKKLCSSGLDAVRLFKEGKIFDLLEYCQQDVKITKELFEYGVKNGFVFFTDHDGNKVKIPVKWKN